MATALPRRLLGISFSLLLACVVVGIGSGTANAASGYRYWNYFHVKGATYVFAQTGASDYTPKNDAIEAYRYGTSTTAKGLAPRADLSVYTTAKICAGVEAGAGNKRVGVLLDYGTKADAAGDPPPTPRAACAVVPKKADGQQVLQAVARVRFDKFTCGIDGYPVKTCSITVKSAKTSPEKDVVFALPEPTKSESGSSTPAPAESDAGNNLLWPLVGAGVVVVLLAGGGIMMSRRNTSA
jgi:hypothetical protein